MLNSLNFSPNKLDTRAAVLPQNFSGVDLTAAFVDLATRGQRIKFWKCFSVKDGGFKKVVSTCRSVTLTVVDSATLSSVQYCVCSLRWKHVYICCSHSQLTTSKLSVLFFFDLEVGVNFWNAAAERLVFVHGNPSIGRCFRFVMFNFLVSRSCGDLPGSRYSTFSMCSSSRCSSEINDL